MVADTGVASCLCRVCALRKRDPDAGPLFVKMLMLSVQLLQSAELPERVVNGVWRTVEHAVQTGTVGPAALELGVVELAASQLRKLGTAADLLVRHECSMRMFQARPV
jgi:hypothetical protein